MHNETVPSRIAELYAELEGAARNLGLHVPADDILVDSVYPKQLLVPLARKNALERYLHWSFGKRAEQLAQALRAGVRVPEVFVPGPEPKAFIDRSASLHATIGSLARIVAYRDFAVRNRVSWLQHDMSALAYELREHALFVHDLMKNPAVGVEAVQNTLAAAHAVAPQCRHAHLPGRRSDDLLEVLAEHPRMQDWQKAIFALVHKEWQWNLPFVETHILMAGWASFWQMRLIRASGLPSSLAAACLIEYANNIAMPRDAQEINPRLIGLRLLESIERTSGTHAVLSAARDETDPEFIERHLTEEVALRCGLWSWGQNPEDEKKLVVRELADAHGWEKMRDTLARNVGGNVFPALRVQEIADTHITLEHQFEGRGLDQRKTRDTMRLIRDLLGVSVTVHAFFPDDINIFKGQSWTENFSSRQPRMF